MQSSNLTCTEAQNRCHFFTNQKTLSISKETIPSSNKEVTFNHYLYLVNNNTQKRAGQTDKNTTLHNKAKIFAALKHKGNISKGIQASHGKSIPTFHHISTIHFSPTWKLFHVKQFHRDFCQLQSSPQRIDPKASGTHYHLGPHWP